jgi:long-chain acyl-CoA synthetase
MDSRSVKSFPTVSDSPVYAVEEDAEKYILLLGAAREVALQITRTPYEGLTGAAEYIHRASRELVSAAPKPRHSTDAYEGAIFECLRRLLAVWPDIATRRIEGEQIFSGDPGLWKRAMTEWPMGGFARMTADFMIEHELLGGNVVELGAGVGSCSAMIAAHVTDKFVRTDLQPFLLKRQRIAGSVERYDFNERGRWRDLDTIFSVNALHCARDKMVTLRHLFDMLRQGGALVLGEGNPHTDGRRTPWALNPFFGLFRGWWDIGGFVPRERWLAALKQAGFSRTGYVVRLAGHHDLGGIIWAVR